MDLYISEEASMLCRTVDEVATRERFREATAIADEKATFPWEIWEALVGVGLPGLEVSGEYGGAGRNTSESCYVLERLATHSIAASTAMFTMVGFGTHLLEELSIDHDLRKALNQIQTGEFRSCLGLTEASGGADLSQISTRLRKQGSSWLLNGTKLYTTLAGEATHIVVGALFGDSSDPWTSRFTICLVPAEYRNIAKSRISTQALRCCPTYQVYFDDVELNDKEVLMPPEGLRVLMAILNKERLAVGAQSCGLAVRAMQLGIEYAQSREIAGTLLSNKQVIIHRLVDLWTKLTAARLLMRRAAYGVDEKDHSGVLPTMAQQYAANIAHEIADFALQIHGGFGLTTDSEIQRIWRDTRLHLIGPIPREMANDYLGRKLKSDSLLDML